jgi:LacI family transcriptional regulator
MAIEAHENRTEPPRSGLATLRDVAERAGVSVKTVSRVVNNQANIKAATRERVRAALKELNYRPNILARNLIHQRSDTLAVVAWGMDFYGPSRAVVGIGQQAHALGYSLFLNLVGQPTENTTEQVLDSLIARRVDGIIWAVPEVGRNRAWVETEDLRRLPPTVFLFNEPRPGLATVIVDNRAGAAQATRHLLSRHRRKIGVITGPLTTWEARERFAGWQEALSQAGLTPGHWVVEGEWSAQSGERAMRQLLEQAPDLDAVFACSDQIALGALAVADRTGRRVPDDLAVVGYDNIPESAFFRPPLTTVYQQLNRMGQTAVQVLFDMIVARQTGEALEEVPLKIITPELIVRNSS